MKSSVLMGLFVCLLASEHSVLQLDRNINLACKSKFKCKQRMYIRMYVYIYTHTHR